MREKSLRGGVAGGRPGLLKNAAYLLAFMVVTHSAYALPSGDEQIIRQQQRQQEQERQDRLNEPRVALPVPEAVSADEKLPVESTCFVVNQVTLTIPLHALETLHLADAGRLLNGEFHWLSPMAKRFAGRCVGAKGVEFIAKQLTQQLLDHGYITSRVLVPEQDLSGGRLALTVMPGWIGEIRFADPSLYGTWRSAFPTERGQLLNLRDLEQGLEQMKRVPSQDVDMQIVPGKLAGESDVVIAIKRGKFWKVVATLDDTGSRSTGKYQAGVSLALDNPLGLNDLLNIGYTHDADFNRGGLGSLGKSLYYSVPWGYWTLTATANESRYHQTIAGVAQDFVSSGVSDNMALRINRLVYRDQSTQFSIQAQTGKRITHSFIDDTEIEVQRRANSFAELGFNYRRFWDQIQLDLTAAYRKGVPWFGAMQDFPTESEKVPTFYYQLQSLDATLVAPFRIGEMPLRYTGTLHGQTTRDTLYFTEDLSIGSRFTVRGFDGENSLTAEKGFYWRNEVDTPLWNTGQSVYVGVDYGQVYGPNAVNLPGTRLAGAVLGLRGGYGSPAGSVSYDVFIGWPLYHPEGFGDGKPTTGFQLVYQY
ncbi:ShlB/FhaC/HecB family hemolysin secretion/activation protein [Jeongeupia naejangsanensis]|uniref:ShlB/FhaC/HecB family hemolysin secretion/activation protein n=2 Tax=Jeongeupia naejangsanensis TaxID=613195 RepID=A0ABS2BGZ1_9NEIS|nr:ShlB/FhaC/HecB family hemolysin secretion/activation protein [Jeongeupia naejangsanensis]MBM3114881.1 ShlB/FhaC/HecB family hemolysin secretion/activation protein [Jeongeupia naejangsanensis]